MATPLIVLDQAQLKRIEAVHRGFLYQHLYAAACLLLGASAGAIKIVVEADEDIEIAFSDRHVYLQIKTRSEPVGDSDIADAMERFQRIREEYTLGRRTRNATFAIVANVPPGPKLLQRVAGSGWPSDVALIFPGHTNADTALPEPWRDIPTALVECAKIAATLPFSKLAPETLILKLAAAVAAASAGIPPRVEHTFNISENSELFEQIAIQLHEIPAPPPVYRAQADEPDLLVSAPVRLIVGFSGSGKTSWIAEAALHTTSDLVYFDVGDASGSAIALPLARELAGRFFGKGGQLGEILLPGATGTEMLRVLSHKLKAESIEPILIVDNAHRASPEHLVAIIRASPNVRYVLLAQPGPSVNELETSLTIQGETLSGWTADTVAAEASDAGCRVHPQSAQKLLDLTAGLPLYIQNASRIAFAE